MIDFLKVITCRFSEEEVSKDNLNYRHTFYEILYSHFNKHPEFPFPNQDYRMQKLSNPIFYYNCSELLSQNYLELGKIKFCHSLNPENGLFDPHIVEQCLEQALTRDNVLFSCSNVKFYSLVKNYILKE